MAIRVTLDGVVRGQTIDLDGETGLPDGTHVQVTVETPPLTLDERRSIIDRVAGVWANDDSIDAIFGEIAARRRNSRPRPVDFDAGPRG